MFRREFADIISKAGMVPLKDLKQFLADDNPNIVSELNLLSLPYFKPDEFSRALSQKSGIPSIDLSQAKISDTTMKLMSRANMVKYRSIPVMKTSKGITVATFDPTIIALAKDLQIALQRPVEFILTDLKSWKFIFEGIRESVDEILHTIKEVRAGAEEKDIKIKEEDVGEEIINYVNRVLADAFVRKASDIHFEPYEGDFRIRFRMDGNLVEQPKPPQKLMRPIVSRLKIMAQMDIAEKRKPQDGRIKLSIAGKAIDYRVSSLPTLFGEKVVLRLLDKSNLQLDMTKLGFEKAQLQVFKDGINQPYGMCLVTGPTGSGKTTTLYSALAELNKIDTNISTAEDPVEFNLVGINQVNVKKDIGLTFAAALKAFLRQDPDVIMVGEIRDFEVAEIAVEAALTGHLVLSTLHTNDAPSTVTRILNMGIEPFLVTGALNVVVAQRLCRKICENCKTKADIPLEALISCGLSPNSASKIQPMKGAGCDICAGSGYKGRVAIYEVMGMSPALKEMILKRPSSDDLKKIAIKEGMKTLRMAALTKVAQGVTTLDEAISNTASDKLD